jgi:hypothetical protein
MHLTSNTGQGFFYNIAKFSMKNAHFVEVMDDSFKGGRLFLYLGRTSWMPKNKYIAIL